jgi:hypothetical protein
MLRWVVTVLLGGCATVVGAGARATTTHDEYAVEGTGFLGAGITDYDDNPDPDSDDHGIALISGLEYGLGIARNGGEEQHVSGCVEYVQFERPLGWHARACWGEMLGEYGNEFVEGLAGLYGNVSHTHSRGFALPMSLSLDAIAGVADTGDHGDRSGSGGFVGLALSYRAFYPSFLYGGRWQ